MLGVQGEIKDDYQIDGYRWPRKERARAKVRALMDAALDLWETDGFDAVSVDDVCAKAGLAKGTFYSYFEKKELLLIALVFSRLIPEPATMKALLGSDRSTVSVCDELASFMAAGVQTFPKPLVQKSIEKCFCQHSESAKLYTTNCNLRVCIRQIVVRGVSRGEVQKYWRVSTFTGTLCWSLLQGIHFWSRGLASDEALEPDLRERVEILIHGAATARSRTMDNRRRGSS